MDSDPKTGGRIVFALFLLVFLIPCVLDGVTFQEPGGPWFASILVLLPLTLLTDRL